jgi:hypothetical protein
VEEKDLKQHNNRTEPFNGGVMSGMGSPLVKQARESTPNDIAEPSGAIRVAPSAKSEAVQGRIPSKGRRLPNCLFYHTNTVSRNIFST